MKALNNRYLATLLLSMTAQEAMTSRPGRRSLPVSQGDRAILERSSPDCAPVVKGLAVKVFFAAATATRGQIGSPEPGFRQRIARIAR